MLILDQLKKDDRQLRALTLAVLGGLGVLLAGLWWVQVVSARDYQENLQNQSLRTERIPALRGQIVDRNGAVLAINQPSYNVSLYLEDLRKDFQKAGSQRVSAAKMDMEQRAKADEQRLGRPLTKQERKHYTLSARDLEDLRQQGRADIAGKVVESVSGCLGTALPFDPAAFARHCARNLAMPFPVATDLSATQVHRFEEQCASSMGVDLELRSLRYYPNGETAAHVLGHLQFDDSSAEGEDAFFSYRLPDYKGLIGIEGGMDRVLRGHAGAKSVVVNNYGYRHTEEIWSPVIPGSNVVLTIDLRIQKAAEAALREAPINYARPVRGAVVVMDVNSGDIVAMASSPTYNPNSFVPHISGEDWHRITNSAAEKNRAMQEMYMPGSIFKTVVALAGLEAGWNPHEEIAVPANKTINIGGDFKDTVDPGRYDLKRAIVHSSNIYFATLGLWVGAEKIVRLAQRFHLGERTGLGAFTRQETKGNLPALADLHAGWVPRATANICIGQDPVWVTPLQIAVVTSALANGGKVLWPRLVQRVEPMDATTNSTVLVFTNKPPRDQLGVSAASMRILQEAMLAETEDAEGTGHPAALLNPGLHICGKTGTAQVQNTRGNKTGQTTWFASFAPFEQPRWAVVVMVEDGISGGRTCSPVAGHIYQALAERERRP